MMSSERNTSSDANSPVGSDTVQQDLEGLIQRVRSSSTLPTNQRVEALNLMQTFINQHIDFLISSRHVGIIMETIIPVLENVLVNVISSQQQQQQQQQQDNQTILNIVDQLFTNLLLLLGSPDNAPILNYLFKRLHVLLTTTASSPTSIKGTSSPFKEGGGSSNNPKVTDHYLNIIKGYLDGVVNNKPDSGNHSLSTLAPSLNLILTSCRNILDSVEETHAVSGILDIIETIGVHYPTLVNGTMFHDTIDLLAGWFLDRDTSFKLRQRISGSFIVLRPLFVQNVDWTCSLLEKFIIDMKTISEERQYNTFVACFAAIVSALGHHFSSCAPKLMNRLFSVFVASLDKFTDKHKRIWKSTSDCITVLASELGKDFGNYAHGCMDFFGKMLKQSTKFELPFDWFDVVINVLASISSELKMDHLKPLFTSILSFVQVIQNTSPDIHFQFGRIYRLLLLDIQQVGITEKLQQDLIDFSFNEIPQFESCFFDLDGRWNCSMEMTVSFQLGMLIYALAYPLTGENDQQICKHIYRKGSQVMHWIMTRYQSWIALAQLSPRIFFMFLDQLHREYSCLLDKSFGGGLIVDDSLIASTLCSLFLVLNSSGIATSDIKICVVSWLVTLLALRSDKHGASLFHSVKPFISTVLVPKLLPILFNDRDVDVRCNAVSLASSIIHFHIANINDISSCCDACLFQLFTLTFMAIGDMNEKVWTKALKEMSSFAPLLMDENIWNDFKIWRRQYEGQDLAMRRSLPLSQQNVTAMFSDISDHQQIVNSTTFKSSDFALLFEHFRGDLMASTESFAYDFERLYMLVTCHIASGNSNFSSFTGRVDQQQQGTEMGGVSFDQDFPVVDKFTPYKCFFEQWAIFEGAKYCLLHRFRTTFGNAFQTFESFESLLKMLIEQHINLQNEKLSETTDNGTVKRMSLFLDFLNELEKQMTLIIDGYKTVADYPQNTLTFFQSNMKVCQDWFSRLRPLMVQASDRLMTNSSSHIRNSAVRISEIRILIYKCVATATLDNSPSLVQLESAYSELENTLLRLCITLNDGGDSDSIVGMLCFVNNLHSYCMSKISQLQVDIVGKLQKKFDAVTNGMRGMLAESKGQFESALHLYLNQVLSHPDLRATCMEANSVTLIMERVLYCYTALRDWEGLDSVKERHHQLVDSSSYSAQTLRLYDVLPLEDKPQQVLDSISQVTMMSAIEESKKRIVLHNLQRFGGHTQVSSRLSDFSFIRDEMLSLNGASANGARPYLSQLYLHYLNTGNEEQQDVLVPFMGRKCSGIFSNIVSDNKSRFLFLDQLLMSRPTQEEEKVQLTLLATCDSAIRTCNLEAANHILADTRLMAHQDAVVFEKAKILYSTPSRQLDGIRLLCKTAQSHLTQLQSEQIKLEDEMQKRSELSKILLKVYDWVNENTSTQSTVSEILPIGSMNLSEYLLKKVVENAPNNRVALLKYAQWCMTADKQDEAMVAYLKCLQYSNESSRNTGKDIFENDEGVEQVQEANVMIVLHLLRFFTSLPRSNNKIIDEQVVSEGIDATPASVWFDIIPQILSHIANQQSSQIEQNLIRKILLKIGREKPQLLAYPLIIGKRSNSAVTTAGRLYREVINELMQQQIGSTSNIHAKILDGVEVFVNELSRITMLREEKWLNSFPILVRRLERAMESFRKSKTIIATESSPSDVLLRDERLKCCDNISQVLVSMRALLDVTTSAPETKHEHIFQDKYESTLNRMINSIQQELQILWEVDASDFEFNAVKEAIRTMNNLQKTFTQHIYYSTNGNKRSTGLLKLQNISPILSNIQDLKYSQYHNCIPIPGGTELDHISSSGDDATVSRRRSSNMMITVFSFKEAIQIVASKTKPKRLTMVGSDGKEYTYLLKGKEDLHLDERIMQFLRIVNTSLLTSHDSNGGNNYLRARNYAVVPLGDRSGLIRWVDGAVPIFSLHRRWYMQKQQQQQASLDNHPTLQPFRPVDQFYDKLIPALKEAGIRQASHPYPIHVLRKVYKEMVSEMPRDLLAKEIWLKSADLSEWWDKSRMFNRSLGVMSIIGYIIGLGDRHLDNILYDYNNGEVVHIDYNVCFDKGLLLKIPEIVPFRMTPVLQNALGLTGVDGMFRLACERTLKVMKQSKQTLLMLLEAFVYDPLVDWQTTTATSTTTNAAKPAIPQDEEMAMMIAVDSLSVEHKVTLGLFKSRIEEVRSFMKQVFHTIVDHVSQNRNYFLKIVEYLNNNLQFMKEYNQLRRKSSRRPKRAMVSSVSHLSDDSEKELQARLEEELRRLAGISDMHNKVYESVISTCTSLEVLEHNYLIASTNNLLCTPAPQLSQTLPYIYTFLKNVSYDRYQQLESEVSNELLLYNNCATSLLSLLADYCKNLSNFTPMQYMETNKSYILSKCLQQVLIDPSLDNIENVYDFLLAMDFGETDQKYFSKLCQGILNEYDELKDELNSLQDRLKERQGVISFLEKSGVESFRHVLTAFSQQLRQLSASPETVFHSVVSHGLYAMFDHIQTEDVLHETPSFFGVIPEDDSLQALGVTNTESETNITDAMYDWKPFSKLTRIVSYLEVLINLETDVQPPTTTVHVPTSAQLNLLKNGLKRMLGSAMELLTNFTNILYPETLKALSSGDEQIVQSLCAVVSLGQDQPRSTAFDEYSKLVAIDQSNPGSILLAAYEGLFNACENNFKEFNLSQSSVDSILFHSKLHTLSNILAVCIGAMRSQINESAHSCYKQCMKFIQQTYVNVLIEQITITTLISLLNTWGISEQNRQVAAASNIGNLIGEVLKNSYTSQQVLDVERLNVEITQLEITHMKYRLNTLATELFTRVWNSLYYEEIATDLFEDDDISEDDVDDDNITPQSFRSRQTTSLSERHELYSLITYKRDFMKKLKSQYELVSSGFGRLKSATAALLDLEGQILSECTTLCEYGSSDFRLNSNQVQVLLHNWRQKGAHIDLVFQNSCQSLIGLTNKIVEMESYKKIYRQPVSDNTSSSQVLQLIEEWKSVQHHQQVQSRDLYKQEEHESHGYELERMTNDYQNVKGTFSLLVNTWMAHVDVIQRDSGHKYENILTELSNLVENVCKVVPRVGHTVATSLASNSSTGDLVTVGQELYDRITEHLGSFKQFLADLNSQRVKLLGEQKDLDEDNLIDLLTLTSIDQIVLPQLQQEYDTIHKNCAETNKFIVQELMTMCKYIQQPSSTITEESKQEQIEEQTTTEDVQQQLKISSSSVTHASVDRSSANSYAVGVLRRVQSRLDDERDVSQQVQAVIEEATNIDNLSSMYEGWCPFC